MNIETKIIFDLVPGKQQRKQVLSFVFESVFQILVFYNFFLFLYLEVS